MCGCVELAFRVCGCVELAFSHRWHVEVKIVSGYNKKIVSDLPVRFSIKQSMKDSTIQDRV